jgi:hypothetical protein
MRITCPECSKNLTVKDELEGKRVKCPGCGIPFVVQPPEEEEEEAPAPAKSRTSAIAVDQLRKKPPPEETEDDSGEGSREEEDEAPARQKKPVRDDDDEEEPRPKKKKKKKAKEASRKKLLWFGIGGGAAAVAIAVVLVIVLSGGNKDDKKGGKQGDNKRDAASSDPFQVEQTIKTGITRDKMLQARLCLAISQDGSLAAVSGTVGSPTVKVYELKSGSLRCSFDNQTSRTSKLAISPDNVLLAVGEKNDSLFLRDLKTGASLRELKADGRTFRANHLAFTSMDTLVGSSGFHVYGWDCTTGTQIFKLEIDADVCGLASLPDPNKLLVLARDRGLKVWNLSTKTVVQTINMETPELGALSVSADGKLAVAAAYLGEEGGGQTASVYELDTGQKARLELKRRGNISHSLVLRDNKTVALIGIWYLGVFDANSHANKFTAFTEESSLVIEHIGRTPDGRLAVLFEDGTLQFMKLKE